MRLERQRGGECFDAPPFRCRISWKQWSELEHRSLTFAAQIYKERWDRMHLLFPISHYSHTPDTSISGISFRLILIPSTPTPVLTGLSTCTHPINFDVSVHSTTNLFQLQPHRPRPLFSHLIFFSSTLLSTFNFFQPQEDLARCTWR
jgi:hypothetical protein